MVATPDISFSDISEVYLEELRRGKRVSVQALAKQFPQFAQRILAELPTMAALDNSLRESHTPLPLIPNYELLEEIGRGASGIVFKARHHSGKVVAIKLVKVKHDCTNLSRLDREIDSLSRLRHSHIVSIEEFGACDDTIYIVTNWVEGIPLAELCAPNPSVQARYWISELNNNWQQLAVWGQELGSALAYIHQKKIVHRDIKPSNLLVDKNGKCWIIDFGLAKLSEPGATLSYSGQVVGTPRFMAPEQFRGFTDPRCDIYSLGRTLFELAVPSHERNHNGCPVELLSVAQINPDVPPELGRIIDKACEPQAERRYQSAVELVAVLDRFLGGKAPSDRRRFGKRMTEEEFKASMRRRVRYAIAGGALCFLVTLAILAYPSFSPGKAPYAVTFRKPDPVADESFKKLVSVIEDEKSGFAEVIGEAIKHSVVTQHADEIDTSNVSAKIDRIIDKVTSEGIKPGELDSLIDNYRASPLMNGNKVMALHQPLHYSTLSQEEKLRGHATLDLFSKAIINKRVEAAKADRVLASLFQGEIPKLEQIISLRIPDESLASWLRLVESSFGTEFQSLASERKNINAEVSNIIDNYLQSAQ